MTVKKPRAMALVWGSGNIYRDFGRPNADLEQLRALLAAEIIKTLDREKLSVREAERISGFAAADFSRIRNVRLSRFTIDRLILILNGLGARVDVAVRLRRGAVRRTTPARAQLG
jgi:predicted XRE-type DNA-binding protein